MMIMLYKGSYDNKLNFDLFKNPTKEYKGMPFWSWNCRLNKEVLGKQIKYLKEMGYGGFFMHSRTGMATEYISDEFMDMVKFCNETAKKEEMLSLIYDEDRWPSGFSGGIVTKIKKYRIRRLIITQENRTDDIEPEKAYVEGKPYFIACYDVTLNDLGEIVSYANIGRNDSAKGEKWYAFSETSTQSAWFNNQTYVDTMNKEAVDKFLETTYEKYYKEIGNEFSTSAPIIFTDEPAFEAIDTLKFATDKEQVLLPWTFNLPESFIDFYGYDLLDFLPEIIWQREDGKVSQARYHFIDHVTERFSKAFAENIGKWCEEHNIMFSGHILWEPFLESQTQYVGEAMRFYKSMHIPGMDLLANQIEFTTAKQASSIAHQYGREGVLSELYGATNWDFDFRGHKFQGDWQAAFGITLRTPHLSWMSMEGAAKRDYPASLNYQVPWYKEYSYVEKYFSRLNTVLTRGKIDVKIGVIHPVESMWIHWGPNASTNDIRKELESRFQNITDWLAFGLLDFDYISESVLPAIYTIIGHSLKVGQMEYETIIVPACITLRNTTMEILREFKANGGNLIFMGACPNYVNAVESNAVQELYKSSVVIGYNKYELLKALDTERTVDIRNIDGTLTENLVYQMRYDSDCKWLFIAHGKIDNYDDIPVEQEVMIKIKGEFVPTVYDAINGEKHGIPYENKNGWTILNMSLFNHDSVLLRLGKECGSLLTQNKNLGNKVTKLNFKESVNYKRAEPNVVLLDIAEYAIDDGEFHPKEEILKICNKISEGLGLVRSVIQPWAAPKEEITHSVTLKFTFNSEIEADAMVALENPEIAEIILNNQPVTKNTYGYYVDEAIKTIKLPKLKTGENILTLKYPYGSNTYIESCYIIGDFDVVVKGCNAVIKAPTDKISFSSVVGQGMPFYGGNIIYETEIETDDCNLKIRANYYRGAVIHVKFDGQDIGVIAYSPYELNVENVNKGKHTIEFELFGNRYNTFAALHNIDWSIWSTTDPNTWHVTGDKWSDEYNFKEMGILKSPVIEIYKPKSI